MQKIYFKKQTDHSLKAYKKQKNYYSGPYKIESENFQQFKSFFCKK